MSNISLSELVENQVRHRLHLEGNDEGNDEEENEKTLVSQPTLLTSSLDNYAPGEENPTLVHNDVTSHESSYSEADKPYLENTNLFPLKDCSSVYKINACNKYIIRQKRSFIDSPQQHSQMKFRVNRLEQEDQTESTLSLPTTSIALNTSVYSKSHIRNSESVPNLIDLSYSDIRNVEAVGQLPDATGVLLLSNNQISCIPSSFLSHLSKLEHLDLSNNKVTFFDCPPLPCLLSLSLSGNLLTSLPNLHLAPSLKALDLSHNAALKPLTTSCILKYINTSLLNLEQLWIQQKPDPSLKLTKDYDNQIFIDGVPQSLEQRSQRTAPEHPDSLRQTEGSYDYTGKPGVLNKGIIDNKDPVGIRVHLDAYSQKALYVERGPHIEILNGQNNESDLKISSKSLCSSCGVQTMFRSKQLDAINKEKAEMEEQLMMKENLFQTGATELSDLSKRCRELETDLNEAHRNIMNLENQLEGCETRAKQQASKLLFWQAQSTERSSRISDLDKEKTCLINQLNEMSSLYQTKTQSFQETLESMDSEVLRIQNELKDLIHNEAHEKKKLVDKMREAENERQRLLKELSHAVAKINDHEAEARNYQQRIEESQNQLNIEKEALNSANNQLHQLRLSRDSALSERLQLEDELRLLRREADRTKEKLNNFKDCVPRRDMDELHLQCAEFESKYTAQKETLSRVTERNETLRLEMNQLKASLLAAEKMQTDKDVALQLKAQQLQDSNVQSEVVKGTLAAKNKETEILKNEIASLRKLNEESELRLSNQNEDLRRYKELIEQGTVVQYNEEKKRRIKAEEDLRELQKQHKQSLRLLETSLEELEKDIERQKLQHSKNVVDSQASLDKLQKEALSKDSEILQLTSQIKDINLQDVKLKNALLDAEKLIKERDDEMQVLLCEMENQEAAHRNKLATLEEFFKSLPQ